MPDPPAPTPKKTKLNAKAMARKRKTHFARRRSFGKNIRSSAWAARC